MRHKKALSTAAVVAVVSVCAQLPAASAQTQTPLPASDYTTRAVCPPPAPGHATCMAVALVPQSAVARDRTHPVGLARAIATAAPSPQAGDFGLRPQDLHSAYSLPTSSFSAQTIALVDAYNDLTAAEDLAGYENEFNLNQCSGAGCFTKLDQNDQTANLPFPQTKEQLTDAEAFCAGSEKAETTQKHKERETACREVEAAKHWTVETSLDLETARAICQTCHIVLVEANSDSFLDLDAGEEAAVHAGATEISNSWGGPECLEAGVCVEDAAVFEHPGIVITASAGDEGFDNWLEESPSPYANFPASSPDVIAVGGTRLQPLGVHGEWAGETVWNDGGESEGLKDGHGATGGGCSVQFEAQRWQQEVHDWTSVGCADKRAVADISADGDPYSGVAVHDSSSPECETHYAEEVVEGGKRKTVKRVTDWCTIGGTSLASPLIASTFALAGGAHGVAFPAQTLYENAAKSRASLHDVTEGSNGECLAAFDEETATQPCSPTEDAQTSCAGHLICLASADYDGPSGLGTPNGIGAFEPPGEGGEAPGGASEKGKAPESPGSGGTGGGSGEHDASAAGAGSPVAASGPSTPASGAGTTSATGSAPAHISALALTLKALVALNSDRPRLTQVGFTFVIDRAVHVRAALQRRVVKHGRGRWIAVGRTVTLDALSGRDNAHLSGRGVLGRDTYRLTLAPVRGAMRSLVFQIG